MPVTDRWPVPGTVLLADGNRAILSHGGILTMLEIRIGQRRILVTGPQAEQLVAVAMASLALLPWLVGWIWAR